MPLPRMKDATINWLTKFTEVQHIKTKYVTFLHHFTGYFEHQPSFSEGIMAVTTLRAESSKGSKSLIWR